MLVVIVVVVVVVVVDRMQCSRTDGDNDDDYDDYDDDNWWCWYSYSQRRQNKRAERINGTAAAESPPPFYLSTLTRHHSDALRVFRPTPTLYLLILQPQPTLQQTLLYLSLNPSASRKRITVNELRTESSER
ncbi:hypothetical protein M0802_002762 [Mischocyttarus mexicanus]|nr:hypothetical protein M0802_002762 [Mischocyttarus mexicanus]